MLGALEDHHLEGDESLSVPAAMPNSCEFRGQRAPESPPHSPTQRILAPRGHDCQRPPPHLPHDVVVYSPIQVLSIIGFHTVSVHRLDPPDPPTWARNLSDPPCNPCRPPAHQTFPPSLASLPSLYFCFHNPPLPPSLKNKMF